MKTLGKRLFSMLAIALIATFSFTSCDDDDDPVIMQDSIVAIAQATPELSILVDALTKFPDLVDLLSTDGNNTVFAPTNTAFVNLLGVIGQTDLDDIPESVLRRVLTYHVIAGARLASTDLTDGQTAATALGPNDLITVGINGTTVNINTATVITPNVPASNGIVHVIDAVLVPELELSIVNTVVEPAYFNNDFTILTEAVVTAGLLPTLIDRNEQYTVFAPTNDAFAAAGINSLAGLTASDLEPILEYHVLSGEVKEADLPVTGSAVATLDGNFYLSINNDGVFINGTSEVVATDIDVDNGVVHVIDRTLMPPSQTITEIAIEAAAANPGEFTQLVAALSAVEAGDAPLLDLVTVLDGQVGAPYTVFAPTDAAFNQLYIDAGVPDLDSLISTVGLAVVQEVLLYHVLNEARVFSTDLPNLPSSTVNPATVGNTSFTIDVANLTITETDAALGLNANDVANIIGTDILATNGIVHTIDKVILP